MQLSKLEIKKIAKSYNLGNVKSVKLMAKGLVNYNFSIKTDKGDYIIRGLGKKWDDYREKKLEFQFKVIKYLKLKKFPYKLPYPILSNEKKEVLRINKKTLWVYEKIKGTCGRKINNEILKELGKAIAIYHKYIRGFKIKKGNKIFDLDWVRCEYEKFKKIKPKNEIDRLVYENVSIFEKALNEFSKKKISKNLLVTHSDFNLGNVVFDKNKIVGIIDFENLQVAPRIYDLSQAIKFSCVSTKINKKCSEIIIKEYEKLNPLKKDEKDSIIDLIIFGSCCEFAWFYSYFKKSTDKKRFFISSEVKLIKNLLKDKLLKC
ncbi:MAG: phosphotransferase [Candidatus Nanoarchaeia archaeon]|jgi:Ser/Thr protein kinase RdoA (MazF antagonist)